MGVIKNIFEYIHRFGIQKKEYFRDAQDEIMKTNLLNLHRFSYVLLILEAVFLVVYLKDLTSGSMILLVIGMILLQLVFALFISFYKDRPVIKLEMVYALSVLQLFIIHALLVFLAIFPITPAVIVYYPLIYVLTPILFVLDLRVSDVICGISSFSLILLSVIFSEPMIRTYNISAAIAAFVLSFFISFFVMDFRLRHYEIQKRLREMSSTDELTGIFNKSMTDYLCRIYYGSGSTRRTPKSALMVIGIDGFKKINEAFGHREGDRILSEAGNALRGIFREDDVAGRIGGDEFLVLLKNTNDWNVIQMKAQQILDAAAKIRLNGAAGRMVSCSVGIAMSPNCGSTYEELFSKADRAMYQSRKKQIGRFLIYSPRPDMVTRPAILVADDSEIARETVRNIFRDRFEILEAADGQEAMNMLHDYHEIIEAVILDLIMPKMDGEAVMEAMMDDPQLRAIPVMVTTADPTKELRALKMGAADLIVKPFNSGVMKQRVENLLHS